jgi:predicted transport protein
MADEMLDVVRALDPDLELKYNKFYIGLAKGGQPNNFVIFRPKKDWLRLEVRLDRSDETQAQLDGSGLDVMDYDSRWGRYRIRLSKGDATKHREFLTALMTKAFTGAA